jgi:alcohol dehydrogenase class IV
MILGLSHRIGHLLGGTYGVPHSLTSLLTLAPVMRAAGPAAREVLAAVDQALDPGAPLDLTGRSGGDPERAADRILALSTELGLPSRLRDVGIERHAVDDLVARLRTAYPAAVAWLGEDADRRLTELVHGMW